MAERKRPAVKQGQQNGAAQAREVPIQVMVPKAVRRQVALMGAERGENIRTLVLRGLQSIGIRCRIRSSATAVAGVDRERSHGKKRSPREFGKVECKRRQADLPEDGGSYCRRRAGEATQYCRGSPRTCSAHGQWKRRHEPATVESGSDGAGAGFCGGGRAAPQAGRTCAARNNSTGRTAGHRRAATSEPAAFAFTRTAPPRSAGRPPRQRQNNSSRGDRRKSCRAVLRRAL